MRLRVSFDFEPDEPDPSDRTGMSEDEYLRLTDTLTELGAENVRVDRVHPGTG